MLVPKEAVVVTVVVVVVVVGVVVEVVVIVVIVVAAAVVVAVSGDIAIEFPTLLNISTRARSATSSIVVVRSPHEQKVINPKKPRQ